MCEEYILRRRLFGMEVLSRHGVLVIPFEKISCLVPLRTGMLREPDHRTLHTHQSLLNGRRMDADQLDGATTTRLLADSVGRYGHGTHTLLKQHSDL